MKKFTMNEKSNEKHNANLVQNFISKLKNTSSEDITKLILAFSATTIIAINDIESFKNRLNQSNNELFNQYKNNLNIEQENQIKYVWFDLINFEFKDSKNNEIISLKELISLEDFDLVNKKTTQLIRIEEQLKEIKVQNQAIEKQNQLIEKQNQVIENQNNEIKKQFEFNI